MNYGTDNAFSSFLLPSSTLGHLNSETWYNGRLTLGVGVGGREDDFEVVGKGFSNRDERWDEALELLQQAWQGEPVAGSPKPVTPPPVRMVQGQGTRQ
ncbi:MAG: LLM class flavin-dependent oxidoreductase [Chloroflexota bacterium]|nr:LLM class flavin-dependent oxidoreductase [Chloroflexota bacterium]